MRVRACNSTSTKPTAAFNKRSIDRCEARDDGAFWRIRIRVGNAFNWSKRNCRMRLREVRRAKKQRWFVRKLRRRRFDQAGLSWIDDLRDVHQETKKKGGLARWTTKMGMGVKRRSAFSRWRRFGSVEFYFSPDRRLCGFAYVFRSRVTYSSFVQQRSKIGVVLVNEDQLVALS